MTYRVCHVRVNRQAQDDRSLSLLPINSMIGDCSPLVRGIYIAVILISCDCPSLETGQRPRTG